MEEENKKEENFTDLVNRLGAEMKKAADEDKSGGKQFLLFSIEKVGDNAARIVCGTVGSIKDLAVNMAQTMDKKPILKAIVMFATATNVKANEKRIIPPTGGGRIIN